MKKIGVYLILGLFLSFQFLQSQDLIEEISSTELIDSLWDGNKTLDGNINFIKEKAIFFNFDNWLFVLSYEEEIKIKDGKSREAYIYKKDLNLLNSNIRGGWEIASELIFEHHKNKTSYNTFDQYKINGDRMGTSDVKIFKDENVVLLLIGIYGEYKKIYQEYNEIYVIKYENNSINIKIEDSFNYVFYIDFDKKCKKYEDGSWEFSDKDDNKLKIFNNYSSHIITDSHGNLINYYY